MRKISKRILDLLISLSAAVLLLPVFFIIGTAIKISDKGTIIFKQKRAGKNGKPFTFYKFRTMRTNVDPFGPSPKTGDDPRLTKVGKFLREYSLDELPQLVNVLKGDMSIVGPRPLYMEQMKEWNERQKKRLLVKPGITGLAQISGRGELTREEKLELDVKYVETASLWLDFKIILATIAHVFKRKDIYEKRYSETEKTRGDSKERKC
jgi:undecaprenyl phosphate N,N'-diacetylbacillosamine 1-phosphate transferase